MNFTSKTLAGQSKKLKLVSSIAHLQSGRQSVCSFVFCLFVVLFSLCVVFYSFLFVVVDFVVVLQICGIVVWFLLLLSLQPAGNSDDIVE